MADIKDIETAEKRVRSYITETPMIRHDKVSEQNEANVYMKCEFEQLTGSFKIRGCLNFIKHQLESKSKAFENGFYAASSGCHALAVSKAAGLLNVEGGIIFVPEYMNKCKEEILLRNNVHLRKVHDIDEAEKQARQTANDKQIPYIPPYNHYDIICGAGTLGLEIQHQLPNVNVVFCPVGGGGLLSGVSSAIKSYNSNIKVIGCEVASSRALSTAVLTGEFIDVPNQETLASGLFGGVESGSITVDICKSTVDEWLAVSEEEIERVIYDIYTTYNKRIEGASATSLAGYLQTSSKYKGKTVVCVLSGCHLDDKDLNMIVKKYGN